MIAINMDKKKLKTQAYKFYPKNINSISDKKKYLNSEQYQNLSEIIEYHKSLNFEESKFFESLLRNNIDDDYIIYETTYFDWMDRCYTYEIINNNSEGKFLLKIFKSILGPYYTFKYFKLIHLEERTKFIALDELYFQNLEFVKKSKQLLQDMNFSEIPEKLTNQKIENINFDDIEMGDFTIFNSFFNSQNF